ncbi:VOC family protein [Streptomyces sp. NPDC051080]|uniref:VOC family protein n=1 Tax=Streptomyces sp. NPDC051080 TaxID=3157222 RepID=UPI00341F4D16
MRITTSTVSLTVDDVAASQDFFTTHLAYEVQAAADGFVSLARKDAAVDIVLLRRGTEVLPADQRDRHASGLILAFTLSGIEDEEKRLRTEGVEITMPLREEPWGERLFQVTDPNGIVVQFVEWTEAAVPAGTGGA